MTLINGAGYCVRFTSRRESQNGADIGVHVVPVDQLGATFVSLPLGMVLPTESSIDGPRMQSRKLAHRLPLFFVELPSKTQVMRVAVASAR